MHCGRSCRGKMGYVNQLGSSMCVTAVAAVLAVTGLANADLVGSYSVGTGVHASYLQFEFANSNTYLYEVRYDGSLRGDDLFAIVAAAQPGFFSYEAVNFSFGDALFGVSIGADANEGFGSPPNYLDYWHYWTRENGTSAWTSSMVGFGDRTVSNGSWDGWVFNSDAQPSAVPAPGAAFALAAVTTLPRRRRR